MKKRPAQIPIRWIIISASIIAAVLLALGLYWLSRPVVTITQTIEGPVVQSFYATGTVQPVTEYPIKTSNAGIITRVFVDKGARVARGQPLAVVEDPQLQFELDKANAQLEQARLRADAKTSPVLAEYDARLQANAATLDNAMREERRFKDMAAKGGSSQSDLDRASDHVKDQWSLNESLKSQREAARIQLATDLAVAKAAVAVAQRNIDLQTLRSPIDGVVLDRPTPLGTRLNVNVNDHVMQIADVAPENLVMRAAVDEENVAELREGQLVQMSLYSFPGRPLKGQVVKIYDKADPDRRTFEVDVKVQPPVPRLAAGMTGELAFVTNYKDRALVAPAQALQGGALFTVRAGRLVKIANPRIGARSVERIELLGDFQPGDVVVISPVLGIADGSPVRTTAIDPRVAAGLNKPKNEPTFKGFN